MSNAVCPRCGSLRTRAVRGNPIQLVVALVRRQTVIACGRCGWQGRQFRLEANASNPTHESTRSRDDDRLDYQALDQAMTTKNDAPIRPGHRS